jgi:cyclohexanone monooxygenase
MFHTSRWPRDYDPGGERVALIGSGASGVQLLPEIAAEVRSLALFQRTPAWVLPKPDWTHSTLTLRLLRRLKGMQPLLRAVQWAGAEAFLASLYSVKVSNLISLLGKWNLDRAIKDPAIREALTPDHVLGCKRVMLSNTYYRALVRDNVEFIPSALAEIRGSTLTGANGMKCEADTIIFATGFHVIDHAVHERVHGKDGRSLADGWNGSPRAYKGVTVAGFPNAFILWGPNGGGPSLFTAVEATLRYVGDALHTMRAQNIDTVEVRAQAERDWKDMANRYTARSVQNIGGCQSFYLDRNGDNLTLFPDSMRGMMRSLSSFDADAYHLTTSKAPATSP